ncbi:MAG: 4-alpha-glucanotransferase, partial [Actinomycetes bacterium]
DIAEAIRAGRALNSDRRIDRDAVWHLKRTALESIWQQVRGAWRPPTDPTLHDHARFCAIAELHDGGWRSWPVELRHPRRQAVHEFAATHRDRVDFWCWVTAATTRQLAAASRCGAQLVGDLAVGFDPDGADAWCDQDLLAQGCRIGAPPDDFAPNGQDWGLPPYVPWKVRASGYQPWLRTIRAQLAHVGALRVDHVMGLFRLYVIPPGASAQHGAYVAQVGTELVDLLVMEASRAGVVLLGEDLGTVEPNVRTALTERAVLGYRVGWFEDDPPASWPTLSLAALTTHDLPTVAGLWTGSDARRRADAGLPVDTAGDALLRHRLRVLTSSGDDRPTDDVVVAATEAIGASPSALAFTSLEDAGRVTERPNQPGTIDELPNWRLALPASIDDLTGTLADQISAAMQRSGRRAPESTSD